VKNVERLLVSRFLQDILGRRQLDLVPQLFSPDVVDHRLGGAVSGIAALTLAIERFLSTFPDLRITLHGLAVESPVAMAWLTWEGTPERSFVGFMGWTRRAPRVTVGSVVVFRAAAGRLTERWEFVQPTLPQIARPRLRLVTWSQFVPGAQPLLRIRW